MKKNADLLNTCKFCGEKWFTTQLQLETHVSEKHGIGSIQCSKCEIELLRDFYYLIITENW